MTSGKPVAAGRVPSKGFVYLQFIAINSLTFLSPPVYSATDAGIDLSLGVIRSDNIFIAPEGEEQSETVYTVSPEFYFTSDDPRLRADIRYQPQAVFYSEIEDSDEIFHILDASATAALLKERFFVELGAANSQTIVAPEFRVPSGNIPIIRNRVDSRVLEVSPYWQQSIGQANLLIRATYSDVSFDDDSLQSSNSRGGYFELGNIQKQEGFAWQMDYVYRETEFEVSPGWEFQRAGLNLGAWVNDSTRLFIGAGAETAFDNVGKSSLDDDFWEAGFQYAPNRRVNLELAAGERSFGKTFRGRLSYEARRGRLSATYSEGPSNRSNLFLNRRPPQPTDDLDGVLDRPGESDRFVLKRGQVNAIIELAKSELSLRAFSETRTERTTAEGEELDDEKLTGFAARWSWQLGRKTTFGISGNIADRSFSGTDDRILRAGLDLTYRLSESFSLRSEVSHFGREDNETEDRDYTENQLRFFLIANF